MEHPPLPVLHYDSQRGPPMFRWTFGI